MADGTYQTKIYEAQGGDTLVVAAGGTVNFDASTGLQIGGVESTGGVLAASKNTGSVLAGTHTVTSGEDTANTCSFASGLSILTAMVVMILRSGAVATGDAAVSASGGTLTVANGATYVLTAGDIIHWMAVGTV